MPFFVVSEDGTHTVCNTNEELVDFVTNFISNLKANQGHHLDMPTYEIGILGENTVFVSGNYIRYNEDGEVISQSGSTYLYQNKPEGWRVISIINKRECRNSMLNLKELLTTITLLCLTANVEVYYEKN